MTSTITSTPSSTPSSTITSTPSSTPLLIQESGDRDTIIIVVILVIVVALLVISLRYYTEKRKVQSVIPNNHEAFSNPVYDNTYFDPSKVNEVEEVYTYSDVFIEEEEENI